ncbi:MAG: type II toxin-antitoxin system HigB family toxin [Gemmataceae bacterium]|nr:type II toxin-antitoxin system HigB family toxin [Gemmataceae bacterium]
MHVISRKKLREFWENPKYANSEPALSAWYQVVEDASWDSFADVRRTYNSADQVGSKTVFNVGGNKFRIVAFIDYEAAKIFVRAVLTHKEYDTGNWTNDEFGNDWKPFREIVKEIQKRKGKPE